MKRAVVIAAIVAVGCTAPLTVAELRGTSDAGSSADGSRLDFDETFDPPSFGDMPDAEIDRDGMVGPAQVDGG